MIELDLDEVAALDRAEIGDLGAVVLLDVLVDDLAVAAGDVDRLVGGRELVEVAVDFQLEAGGGGCRLRA